MCRVKQRTLTILSWIELALTVTLAVSCLIWMLQKEVYANSQVTNGWIIATHIRPWVWYEAIGIGFGVFGMATALIGLALACNDSSCVAFTLGSMSLVSVFLTLGALIYCSKLVFFDESIND